MQKLSGMRLEFVDGKAVISAYAREHGRAKRQWTVEAEAGNKEQIREKIMEQEGKRVPPSQK